VLFIDEIETVAGKRGSPRADAFSQEIVTQMLQEMEGAAKSERQVFVLAATNLPEEVDSAILSRFTSKIEIPLPDESARREILKRLLNEKPLDEGFDIEEVSALLAKRLNRKSGRDLVSLVNRAMERAVMASDSPDDVKLTRAALLAEATPQGKEVSDADLAKVWSKIVLDPAVQDSIVSKIKMFNAADKAAPRGLLLYGPPGTGKTEIARRIADSASCYFMSLSGPDLKAGYSGQSGQNVRAIWDQARARGRCVIFVDECEGVFARRGSTTSDSLTNELVQAFLAEWDGVGSDGMIWVVGATNRVELLDDAIVSRFGASVEIGLPAAPERMRILALEIEKLERTGAVPEFVGQATQGFSGRNLAILARDVITRAAESGGAITDEHWRDAIKALRGSSSAKDETKTWDRLVLPDEIKAQLVRAVKVVQDAERYKERGVNVPNILLYGPPGTGKTDIARTFANEGGVGFISATTADLKAGYVGQSGQKVKELFDRARAQSPCILFIDEIETVARKRGSANADAFTGEIVTQMLAEMEGAAKSKRPVFVLAATNLPEEVDSAILSRFSNKIEIPLPDETGRREMLLRLFKERPLEEGFDVEAIAGELARRTNRKSGRDLVMLVNRAMERAVASSDSPDDVSLTRAALMAELAPQDKTISDDELAKVWAKIVLDPKVKESIVSKIKLFNSGDKAAPKGLLLYGPPGTGKTEIARRIAESANCYFMSLSGPDLKAGYVGQSGQKARQVWEQARSRGRCVMFIDECEGVFARRGSQNSDALTDELVQAFLAEWDGVGSEGQIWVVGATNRRDLIDEAIVSRFGASVEIGLPGAPERIEILRLELEKLERSATIPEFVGQATTGLSGRNLKMLATDIATLASERGGVITDAMWREATAKLAKAGSESVDDSARWDSLILAQHTLDTLKTVCDSLRHLEVLKAQGLEVPRGALLYGPPGTGKTQIARTLANESGLAFLAATTADVKAGYVGQSGQKVRELFERARGKAPCILFIDEVEAVAPERGGSGSDQFTNEIVTQLLQELDGVKKTDRHVFVLAATNLPERVDSAVRSRFEEEIEIPNPDEKQRAQLFGMFLSKQRAVDFDVAEVAAELARQAGDVGGRDIRNIVQRATQNAVRRAIRAKTPDKVVLSRDDLLATLASAN
jgi:SpoVK/Ycf46/Vps4 family AAA+-type ATPase